MPSFHIIPLNLYLKYHTNPTNTLPYFPFTPYTKSKHNLSTLIKYKILKLTKFNYKYINPSIFNTTYFLLRQLAIIFSETVSLLL